MQSKDLKTLISLGGDETHSSLWVQLVTLLCFLWKPKTWANSNKKKEKSKRLHVRLEEQKYKCDMLCYFQITIAYLDRQPKEDLRSPWQNYRPLALFKSLKPPAFSLIHTLWCVIHSSIRLTLAPGSYCLPVIYLQKINPSMNRGEDYGSGWERQVVCRKALCLIRT